MGDDVKFAGNVGKGGEGATPKESYPNQTGSIKEGGVTFAGSGEKDIGTGSTDMTQHDPTKDMAQTNGGKGEMKWAGDVGKGL